MEWDGMDRVTGIECFEHRMGVKYYYLTQL